MKIGVGISLGIFLLSLSTYAKAANQMKLNAGIVTRNIKESKDFYVNKLGLKVRFESDWYLLLHTAGKNDSEIAFLLPDHPTQAPVFQSEFGGKGVFLTIEVPNVDSEYKRLKALGGAIKQEIKNEEWGDRHFVIVDPNGIGVDFVTHSTPSK